MTDLNLTLAEQVGETLALRSKKFGTLPQKYCIKSDMQCFVLLVLWFNFIVDEVITYHVSKPCLLFKYYPTDK